VTIQAIIFLHHFKKIQIKEDGEIWLDTDNQLMKTMLENKGDPAKVRDLSSIWTSIPTMLQYLQDSGLLKRTGIDYYSLTYAGYHYFQTITSSFIRFLLNSIIVPILVSIITTISLFAIDRWLH